MLANIHAWISRRMFFFVIAAMIAGYFCPLPATPVLQRTVMFLFAYMTFATALGTSFKEFLKICRNPQIPLYILAIVHFITPVLAWVAGQLFFPENRYIQMGYLISAAIPVGVTSVIWTSIVRGNVPVSLVTITLDTIIAPVFLPLFILFVIGVAVSINYSMMVVELFIMITLPSIAGMLLHDATKGKTKAFASGSGGILSKIGFFAIIFLNSAFVTPTIVWNLFILKILLVTCLLVGSGYMVGYLASRLIHAGHDITLAVIYNTGMRNIATGLVIATSYFPPEVAIPITLSMLFQQPFAALAAKLYEQIFPGWHAMPDKNLFNKCSK